MESIDKLREYVEDAPRTSISLMARSTLLGMARDIEREVEQLREREYQNGREDARGAVEFADRLCRTSERREDVTLWGVDYMPLPVDADGEAIHVGDVMEWYQGGNVFTVTALHLVSREWEVWGDDAEYAPDECRHHHEPTVEDVLLEACKAYHGLMIESMSDVAHDMPAPLEVIAKYAAKLRLAGDE